MRDHPAVRRGAGRAAGVLSQVARRLGELAQHLSEQGAGEAATPPAAEHTDGPAQPAGPAAPAGPAGPAGPASRYRQVWQPASAGEARQLITTLEDEEHFEHTGRQEAERLYGWVDTNSVVLDLGCGIGRIARYIAPHCATLWAADVSPAMLELARERLAANPNVRLTQADDTSVPEVPDASIDFCYSIIVLQHLEREDAYLMMEDVARMLKPGGTAFVTWPNVAYPFYRDSFVNYAHSGEVANPGRARMYTVAELETTIGTIGFSRLELREEPNIVTICTR